MNYQVLVLDLDGTLTNSKKEITEPTRKALIEIQQAGKIVVLASGRPINGVRPLAEQLDLARYGNYMLSFNGARITKCSSNETIYNKTLPSEVIRPVYELVKSYPGLDIVSYTDEEIISGVEPNEYTLLESRIDGMPVRQAVDFPSELKDPVNKMLITGNPDSIAELEERMKSIYHGFINIYRSEPYFLEVMPQNIDKAHSLHRLLTTIGLSAEQMICCGDGYNDVSMIEYAGLGVAMENAQLIVKEKADFITHSNDEDGVLHVINLFMRS